MSASSRPSSELPETSNFGSAPEGPGARIGPYKLLQEIGEGGFGVVYMAEQQEPVRRQVALKIIKPGMDSKQVIARFESERQALALMDHPNIARVLDAGATDNGRPYFVMELVRGVPITEYCDKNNLTTSERLELFVTVCRAVQHAHQKGVIHRDLKPSNVMVTLHDGQPVTKVIDFGVAKATTQRLTDRTMFTAYGQMIGTPAYMSPEQAEMSGLDIDTRSDIYSLGVLLYELLAGTTPFEVKRLRDASYIEMQRIIREEDPPKPSTRISTLGENQTVIASHRRTDPAKLRQALSGDLDLIVMKALEKERGRRYESPNAFAQDIERFLRREAILARPPSALYRLRKFTERNKATVATASGVALCLLIGTIVSTYLAIQAARQRDAAQTARQAEAEQRKQAEENLVIAATEKAAAEAARADAERERDSAEKLRQAETELRAAADDRRQAIERQANEIASLHGQQRRTLYTAQMNLAQRAWDDDNVARVVELLDAQRPKPGEFDLRGFEWHYWNRMSNSDLQTQKLPLTMENGLAISIAGRTIEFSPDGSRIAGLFSGRTPTARGTDSVRIWDLDAAAEIANLTLPPDAPSAADPSGTPPAGSMWRRWLLFIDRQHLAVNTPDLPKGPTPPKWTELAVYDLATRQMVYTLREQTSIGYVASGDGTKVATVITDHVDRDGQPSPAAKIWDAKTGQQLAVVPLPAGQWEGLAISGNGSRLATTTIGPLASVTGQRPRQLTIKVWDVDSGKEHATIANVGAMTLELSPNGKRLALVGTGQDIVGQVGLPTMKGMVFDADSGTSLWSQPLENIASAPLARPRFSNDGQWVVFLRLAILPHERSLRVLNAATGVAAPLLKGHPHPIVGAVFMSDDRRLRTVANDGTIKTWETPQPTGTNPQELIFNPLALSSLSPDGSKEASIPARSPNGGTLTINDVSKRALLWKQDLPGPVEQFAFSPNGQYVAASWTDPKSSGPAAAQVRIWEAQSGKQVQSLHKTTARRNNPLVNHENIRLGPDFAFSPSGREIALSVVDAATGPSVRVQLVDVVTGGHVISSGNIVGRPSQMEFTPDGKRILLEVLPANNQPILQAIDTATGQAAWTLSLALFPRTRAFNADGSRMYGHTGRQIGVWDTATGQALTMIALTTQVPVKVALSPDGKQLAAVTPTASPVYNPYDRLGASQVTVWNAETGTELFKLQGHSSGVKDIAYSPDGNRIATTAGTSSDTKIWDAATGQELLTLPGADGGLVFAADGRQLVGMASSTPFGEAVPIFGATRRIVIADASSPSPESEAQKLVEVLTRTASGQSLLSRREIRNSIEADNSLNAATKSRALELLQGLRREFAVLNNAAWNIARLKDQPRQQYLRALDLAQEAAEVNPASLLVGGTRGVSYYRLGQAEKARADLDESIKRSKAARRLPAPEDLVFLAMTQHQLGHASAASDLLEQYRRTVARSGSTKLGEWREYLAEADELFGIQRPRPPAPQPIAGWGQTFDPVGDCRFVVSGDSLTIHVPGSLHSLAPANRNFDAPRVLQEVEGDFTAQVKVTCPIEPQRPLTDRGIAFFGAGFLVWETGDHFLRVERNGYFLHPNYPAGTDPPQPTAPRKYSSHAPLVEYIEGGREVTVGRAPFNAATPLLPGSATWLRLIRRGQSIAIFMSHDGQTWEEVPRVDSKLPAKILLGLIARNNSAGEFEATFSEVTITRP